jgi:catechol 2,3-dioxygenase-like lactoylglutathione lyase family enzyme
MKLSAIDHVQLAIPPGGEEQARSFYRDLLGLTEVPKPPEMAKRGGAWFENESVRAHVGIEKDFVPARRAHPAFVVEGLDDLLKACGARGIEVRPAEGVGEIRRFHIDDPFGNRIEVMARD